MKAHNSSKIWKFSKSNKYADIFKCILFYFTFLISSQAQNSWTAKASFTGNRQDAANFTIGSKGYVCAGANTTPTYFQDLWEYDPIANTWTQKANFGGGLRQVIFGLAIGSKGYVGTGWYLANKQDWWEYDPSTNVWVQKTNFPGGLRQAVSGFTIGSKGYVGLGSNSGGFNDFYEYDPSNDTWTQKTNFPGTARWAAIGLSIGSKGYMGIGYDGINKQDWYEYDLNANTWTAKTNYGGTARYSANGFTVGNKGYIGTGYDGSSKQDLYEFDPSLNTWTNRSNFTGAVRYDAFAFSIGNYGYLGGGNNGSTGYSDFYQYTPGTTPSVTTTVISSITSTTASSGGSGLFDANYSVTAKGVVWSTSANPTVALATKTNDGTGTGSFTSSITGLTAGTQYYYRAYATNSQGTSYGTEYTFTTTQNGNSWARHTDFLLARADAIGFSIGSKGYFGTGRITSLYYKDFWEYDPSTCIWTQKADFGGTVRSLAVGFSIGTKGYIGTGTINSGTTNYQDFWEYDQSANTWTQKANFGGTARSYATGFSIGTKGYVGTGYDGANKNDFWEYNQATDTWTQKTNFAGSARTYASGFSIGTKGYIGCGISGSFLKDFYEYDPTANTWTAKANFGGTTREAAVGLGTSSKGYIGTGYDGAYKQDFYEYDPTANTWTAKTSYSGSGRYTACGFAINGILYIGLGYGGSYNSDFYSYYPGSSPTISTTAISSISTTSASSGGNVTDDGGFSVTARGVVWNTSSSPTIALSTKTSDGSGNGAFSSSITSLSPGTLYYVRAYATNSAGTAYGSELSFTTLAVLPTVTSTSISVITGISAITGGNVTNDGGATITERGIVYATVTNPTTSNTKLISGGTTGVFTSNMTVLSLNTTYYVRAYAINSIGTSYGSEFSFTTLDLPTLTTTAISSLTGTTVSSGGNITNDGGATITERGVVYSTTANPTTSNSKLTSAGTTGAFTSNLTGLSFGTIYYLRAYAINSVGTNYGNEISFTTYNLPTLTTNLITNITISSADCGGLITSDGNTPVTSRGVVWSENPGPTIVSNLGISSNGTGIGNYTSNILSLADGTRYYAKAYATNIAGTSYGSSISFTTLALPVIADSTSPYANVTNSTVKVSGRIVSFGDGGLVEHGFAWSTSSGVTTSGTKSLSSNTTIGPVTVIIKNLPIASQIYIVEFVTTNLGTVYGQEFSILTLNYTDTDGDGISDDVEKAGPNNGDVNRNGISDYLEANVTTVATNLPVGSNSATSLSPNGLNYITVQALGCTSITDVFTNQNQVDKNYHYPAGIVEFKIPCGTAQVKIYYRNFKSLQGYVYRKLNKYGNWITYPNAVFGTENFNGKQVSTVILDLKDGENGDSDGLLDGIISDPGGPAILITPTTIPTLSEWARYLIFIFIFIGFWWKTRI